MRRGRLTAAAAILIGLGTLVALFGTLFLLVGMMFDTIRSMAGVSEQLSDIPEAFGGFIVAVGLLVLAFGVLQVVAGIFVLRGRSWARITGLILSTLGVLLALVLVLPGEGSTPTGSLVSLAILAAYGYVFWALITGRGWFAPPPQAPRPPAY